MKYYLQRFTVYTLRNVWEKHVTIVLLQVKHCFRTVMKLCKTYSFNEISLAGRQLIILKR